LVRGSTRQQLTPQPSTSAEAAAAAREDRLRIGIKAREMLRQKKPKMTAKERKEDQIRRRGRIFQENRERDLQSRMLQDNILRRVEEKRQLFRPKLGGTARAKAKLSDPVPHYKDVAWQRDHLIYQDSGYRVYVREVAFSAPDRFNISEHLYQIRVEDRHQGQRGHPAPLISDILLELTVSLRDIIHEIQRSTNPDLHSELFLVFHHDQFRDVNGSS
jgi:hypothetical protein